MRIHLVFLFWGEFFFFFFLHGLIVFINKFTIRKTRNIPSLFFFRPLLFFYFRDSWILALIIVISVIFVKVMSHSNIITCITIRSLEKIRKGNSILQIMVFLLFTWFKYLKKRRNFEYLLMFTVFLFFRGEWVLCKKKISLQTLFM